MILFQWVNDSEYFHTVPKNQKSCFYVWNTQWQTAIKLNEKQAVLRYSPSRVPFYILRWKLCNTRQKQNVRMMPCSTTRLREEQSSAVTIWWVKGKRQNTGGFPIIRTWRYYTWTFFFIVISRFFFNYFLKKMIEVWAWANPGVFYSIRLKKMKQIWCCSQLWLWWCSV